MGYRQCISYIVMDPRYFLEGHPNALEMGGGGGVSLLYVVTKCLFCKHDRRRLKYSGGRVYFLFLAGDPDAILCRTLG